MTDIQHQLRKRNITEHHLIVLIIWRSQVQALAGPQKMKHHLTILHAGITQFKHFMYKQQEKGKLKK